MLIITVLLGVIFVPAHAENTSEFGFQIHPGKLLENTEGILQIFVISNGMMVPKTIENLKAISSDNSIIQIIDIKESKDGIAKNVIVNAKKAGIANIAFAAPGFSSKEISLQVHNNNNHPSQILMKVTPDQFPVDGPRHGYIGLELATTSGLPTTTSENRTIHLDTPNKDVIKLKNSEITIPDGEYYALTEFEIIGSGDAIIFAETEGMKKISSIVEILEAPSPLKLQLYVYPENFNSFSISKGIAIIQLLDGEEKPIIAEEDIRFKLDVENPDSSINTSHDYEELQFEENELVIKKGEYSTFTQFTPRPDLGDSTESIEQEYNIFISVENYLAGSDSITISHDEIGSLEGNGPSVTQVLPFLTTGKKEIIAVTYYETEIEVSRQTGGNVGSSTSRELVDVTVPVLAKDDHSVIFTSSELDTVNPIDPVMSEGENIVVVYGNTGTVIPKDELIFSITDNEGIKSIRGEPIGPSKEDISFNVVPLIPKILAEKEFPTIGYLEDTETEEIEETNSDDDDDGANARLGVTRFIEDAVLTFSANEIIETNSEIIKQNQPYVLSNMKSNEVGTTTLYYQMGGFDGNIIIESHTTDPTEIFISFPENILSNSETLSTLQLLDSIGNPVYAKKDIEIKLVSSDETILKTPESVKIKSGEYFTTFYVETYDEGEIELALLSEDFSLSTQNISVIDISPELKLDIPNTMNWNERIEAKLSVSVPEIEMPLDGFGVEWITVGGEVRSEDNTTNDEGIATLNIIPNQEDAITVTVNISGNSLDKASISKTVKITNIPTDEIDVEETSKNDTSDIAIDYSTILPLIIPISIAGTVFYLKRTDRLDSITDRIPIMDKVSEIKEKISDIRDR